MLHKSATLQLSWLRFISNFSRVTFYSFLALWLLKILSFSPSLSAFFAGTFVFLYRSGSVLSIPLLQWLQGKKYTLFFLQLTASLFFALLYYLMREHSHNPMIWAFLLGVIASIISLANTLIISAANNYSEENLSKIFSYLNIAFNLASGVGPVVGGWVFHNKPQYLPLVACCICLLAAISAFFFRDCTVDKRQNKAETPSQGKRASLNVLRFIAVTSLSMIGYACFYDLFPMLLHTIYSPVKIGIYYGAACLLISILQLPIKKSFIDKLKRAHVMSAGNLILALSVVLIFSSSYSYLLMNLCVLVIAISECVIIPVYQASVLSLARESAIQSASAFAIMSLFWGATESMATYVGILSIHHGFSKMFYLASALFLSGLSIYFIFSDSEESLSYEK